MKPIETEFKRSGFEFKQMWRVGPVAIYGKKKPEWKDFFTFEVVVIREQKAWEAFGRVFEAKEAYPSSEQWGTFGWTARTLDAAMVMVGTMKLAERLSEV